MDQVNKISGILVLGIWERNEQGEQPRVEYWCNRAQISPEA